AAQRRVHQRARSRAVGSVPWPAALGTPPWTAAREARFPGVRYRSVPLDDAADGARHLLAAAHGATLAGVPVPLYTGGDLGHGLTTAVPRHVVLALPAEGTGRGLDGGGRRALDVYEPSSATVRQVALEDLVGRQGPRPALGGWSHVCWVLLPERIAPVGADVHTGTTHPNRRRDMSIGADTGPVQDPEEHEPTPDTVADPEDYDPQLEVEDPVREADPADVAEQTLELPDDDEAPEGELGAGAPDDEPA
ncbi:hypothetical protein PU560_09450, partial [Georgenia sp. 10Sc9-8]|nr:hypothetical protein [Georgenia halotolerans]